MKRPTVASLIQPGCSRLNRQIVGPGAAEPLVKIRLDSSWPAFPRIGHRGAGALEPENTLRSIEAALRFSVEMIEVDVRPCADGTLVLSHDDDLKRVAGRKILVSTSSLAELRTVTMGKGERISTLEEGPARLDGQAGSGHPCNRIKGKAAASQQSGRSTGNPGMECADPSLGKLWIIEEIRG